MQSPEDILQKYWRFSDFRGLQKEAIQSILDAHDTCVFFPTGGGKSLCFQIPALLLDGICIVISPLISLMQDQVNNLKDKGIKALFLKGGMSVKETNQTFDNLKFGGFKFLYMSPEKLQNTLIKEHLAYLNISMIAVDEAHCVSMWGHDFRPAFLKIRQLRDDICPHASIMALTATATERVQQDIITQLNLLSPQIFKQSFKRENIALIIKETDNKREDLINALKQLENSGIVYVRSRKATLDLAKLIQQHRITCLAFHGGLTNEARKSILEKWLRNDVKVIIATTAFGMGIDKPDVSLVYHFHLPENLESYYQEIGRAGRNGMNVQAVLAYNSTDIQRLKFQFLKNLPNVEQIKTVYRQLMSFFQLGFGDGEGVVFGLNISEFSKRYNSDISLNFEVLKLLDRLSIIALEKQFEIHTSLRILLSHHDVLNFLRQNERYKALITLILRTYSGVFDLKTKINLNLLSTKTGRAKKEIIKDLQKLHDLKVIDLTVSHQDLEVKLLQPRGDERVINAHIKVIQSFRQTKISQIEAVQHFVNDRKTCFQIKLLDYFGEKSSVNCGKCTVCLANDGPEQKVNDTDLTSKVLEFIAHSPETSKEILRHFNCNKKQLFIVLQKLLDLKKIEVSPNNTYRIK
jgi:ATP-dependent DNA helicase RecQ